jgi:nucleoside-triphosphatase
VLFKRVFILTGVPGVGKTTVLLKVVGILKEKGLDVGGMISREVREGNVRVGFEIIDLNNSKCGWLAHVNQKNGPQVGKYRVNLEDLNNIGAQAIIDSIEKSTVIAIDEVGPMELFSEKFKQATKQALESTKPVLAVVHGKAQEPLVIQAKSREDAELYVVTVQNRDKLPEQIESKIYDAESRV